MSASLLDIPNLTTGAELQKRQERRPDVTWSLDEFSGRLAELRATGPSSALTFAFRLVFDAQKKNEPVAWICARDGLFFPGDVVGNGIDLEALAVVRMLDAKSAAVAADRLLRCGAFGLLILDLGESPWFPDALQNRLVRHSETSNTAVICLTEARRDARTLGSLVSVRVAVTRDRSDERFRCLTRAERDRKRSPGWSIEEHRDGTMGLR